MSDELSLEEIELLEKEPDKPQIKEKREVSRWPDQFRADLMVAVMEGAEEVDLDGRRFSITFNPGRSNYIVKPAEGFVPRAEVSEIWLMTS